MILLLTSCTFKTELMDNLKVGDCFIPKSGKSGYFKIMEETKYTYITQAFGKELQGSEPWHPIIVGKAEVLQKIECVNMKDKNDELYIKWGKSILKLRKEFGVDK